MNIDITTGGHDDIIDLSNQVKKIVNNKGLKNGIIHLFVPGATAALTTIELEKGLIEDLKNTLRNLIPENDKHKHNLAWGDGNAHSHLRATLIGPSLTIPVVDNKLILGTWQQIVLADFDNRSRNRSIICQLIGEF